MASKKPAILRRGCISSNSFPALQKWHFARFRAFHLRKCLPREVPTQEVLPHSLKPQSLSGQSIEGSLVDHWLKEGLESSVAGFRKEKACLSSPELEGQCLAIRKTSTSLVLEVQLLPWHPSSQSFICCGGSTETRSSELTATVRCSC